jgi:photosystem II stability/assembly factor-like uncharacterized protein
MSRGLGWLCIAALLIVGAAPAFAGLTRHDVLVIANANSAASIAVANYYREKREIPASHVKTVTCGTGEVMNLSEFVSLREQIKAHLISLGTDPNSPATDPIKAIVLSTRIPHRLVQGAEDYSAVDSTLSAMFSECPWGKEPIGIYGYFQPNPGAQNPYYGGYADGKPFEEFRKDPDAAFVEPFPTPGFTMVRMLSSNTALAVGGQGIIYRGMLSGGDWTWSAIPSKDKGGISWRVSGLSVVGSNYVYACTGNSTKPHGGGSIIASTDGGVTWSLKRSTSHVALFKNYEAYTGIDFATPNYGWAVGSTLQYGASLAPLMVKTTNGGANWSDLSSKLPASFFPRAVTAADANNVWICGAGGKIYRSADGGNTWALANVGAPNVDYNAIWIKLSGGSYRGWAVGDSGTIIRTEDGGNSWTIEAAGLTSADITDLAVFDQDHAAASYGGNSFLKFDRSTGWNVESVSLAPVASAAYAGGDTALAVGKTRHIFADSANGWTCSYTGPDSQWRLRYLVMRLDGLAEDLNPSDGIPDDIKLLIDRGCAATSPGKFLLEEAAHRDGYASDPHWFDTAYDALVPIVGAGNVIHETTSAFLTHQNDIIGWVSHGTHDSDADLVTTWARSFHNWVNGAIATQYVSSDARAFDRPKIAWGIFVGGTKYANKLTITGMPKASTYSGHKVRLHAADGTVLASANFSNGTAQIDLIGVNWPADHLTYCQVYFPDDDPTLPGRALADTRYPSTGASTVIYDNRLGGFSLDVRITGTLAAELIREGISGCIASVDEPWTLYIGDPLYLFPRYALGYTWGETSYMGLYGLGWQQVALGDPLMAPYSTPPTVSFTAPVKGKAVAGSVQLHVEAVANNASGIARVVLWLDDDTLLTTLTASPYNYSLDTVARGLTDGFHTLEAVAYEDDAVQNTAATSMSFVVSNSHTICTSVSEAVGYFDDTPVTLELMRVSAVYGDCFYVEDQNRVRGIRVVSSTPVTPGSLVTVQGLMKTVDGERAVEATAVCISS